MEEKRAYEIFADLLLEEKVHMDRRITFARLCRWLGTSRRGLDGIVHKELGMSGKEVVRSLRRAEERRIRDKYMIKGFKL
ncbi:MAG: hypothetical protein ACI3ZC_04200 [Candidatus Cryptobacteroides sp.]